MGSLDNLQDEDNWTGHRPPCRTVPKKKEKKMTNPRELWSQLEIFNGGQVRRFHTWPIIGQQTVAEHSWGVVAIIAWLYPDASRELLFFAIHHDVAEYWTGDVPFQTKRVKPEIKKALDDMEHHYFAINAIDNDETLSKEDKRRLKVADYIECLFFCIQQKRLGSRCMNRVVKNLMDALSSLINLDESAVVGEIHSYYHDMLKEEDHA